MQTMDDFPKIECPFLRTTYKVTHDSWKKHGKKLHLRSPEVYLVSNEITPGYEWVFEDEKTLAVEKLDGTNVKLNIVNDRLVALQNRANVIDPLNLMSKGYGSIIEGVFQAINKGYVEQGVQAGEVVGPKLQGNPYTLPSHQWYPFDRAVKYLTYKSWHEHERTYENLSSWFKEFLKSRFYIKHHKCSFEEAVFAEGVIFYNLKRRDEGKIWRAKLRRDMFDWYYDDVDIRGYLGPQRKD